MMSGKNTWETVNFPQYGIPSMAMSDGPHGLRRQGGSGDHLGLGKSLPATCFPTAATVANSWDESLGEAIGTALAEEAVTMDVNVILGPGLSIKRSPLCGRNFEYFSEDPYHAGKMAAAYVKGIQSKGISACLKLFAANSQELRRMAMNSVVDERTFREIYTTGFEIAIKEGKSKSIMSSYNEVNSVYANENKHLLREILVDEWGYKGFAITDQTSFPSFSYCDIREGLVAGNDIWLCTAKNMWQLSDGQMTATVMISAREAMHRYLYAVANSNVMNGIDHDTVVKNVMAGWQKALVALVIVIVLIDIAAFMAVRRLWTGKNKAQRKEAKEQKKAAKLAKKTATQN